MFGTPRDGSRASSRGPATSSVASQAGASRGLFSLAALVIVLVGLKLAASLVVPLLLAAAIALATSPLVIRLHDRGVPRGLAVALTLLVDLALLSAVVFVAIHSLNELTADLPRYQARIDDVATSIAASLGRLGVRVDPSSIGGSLTPDLAVSLLLPTVTTLGLVASEVVVILLLVTFVLNEAASFRGKLERVLQDPEPSFRQMGRALDQVQRFLAAKTMVSATMGVLVAAWCAIWRVDLPLFWGLFAFLLHYVPNIGGLVTAIPLVATALLFHGWETAAGVGIGYLVLGFALGNVIEPRILGRRLRLSTLVVMVSMVFWGWMLGPFGALLSAPLTMIVKIALESSRDLRWLAVLMGPAEGDSPDAHVEPAAVAGEREPHALPRPRVPPPPLGTRA